jgi:translation initiation factor 2B subunit (eIF-2B alpha/beta/delta family)
MELLLEKNNITYYNPDLFAKAGVLILFNTIYTDESTNAKKIQETKKAILEKEPHNIVLKNALDFFLYQIGQTKNKEEIKEKYSKTIKLIVDSNKGAADFGIKKIKEGATVFVHSLNNQLFNTLEKAAAQKKFSLYFVEHRPFLFGNHLETKLKNKIKTKQHTDIAIRQAVLSSDICFIGADALLKDANAIAKTGANAAIDAAIKANIPVYLFLHSLKYDNNQNHKHQLSHTAKTEKEEITHETVYELVEKEKIDGYICEHGIYSPEHIINEIRFYNGWLFM